MVFGAMNKPDMIKANAKEINHILYFKPMHNHLLEKS